MLARNLIFLRYLDHYWDYVSSHFYSKWALLSRATRGKLNIQNSSGVGVCHFKSQLYHFRSGSLLCSLHWCTVDDTPSTWAPVTHVEDWDGAPGFWFWPGSLWLLRPFGESVSGWEIFAFHIFKKFFNVVSHRSNLPSKARVNARGDLAKHEVYKPF